MINGCAITISIMSYVRAKNNTHYLLKNIGRRCKEAPKTSFANSFPTVSNPKRCWEQGEPMYSLVSVNFSNENKGFGGTQGNL